MIFLVILLVIIIVWLQYPHCNKEDKDTEDKDTNQYIKMFNLIKTPVTVICFILIILSVLQCKKKDLDVYISFPKY